MATAETPAPNDRYEFDFSNDDAVLAELAGAAAHRAS